MDEETLRVVAEEEEALAKELEGARYFYTTDTPHSWSSGPSTHYMGDFGEGYRYFRSLDEAREAALRARAGSWGSDNLVTTTYGVSYPTDNRGPRSSQS